MSGTCGAFAVPSAPDRATAPESPLAIAGHIGSTVALENTAWLAAMNREWSPVEEWLRQDLAAARAAVVAQRIADERIATRIRDAIDGLPAEKAGGNEEHDSYPDIPDTPVRRRRFGALRARLTGLLSDDS